MLELALFLLDFHYFAAFVLAAMRAHAVRELRLVAVRTLGEPGGLQRIVGAAVIRPPLGVSAFWIRHSFLKFRKSGVRRQKSE